MHRPQSNSKETHFTKSEQEVPASSIKSKKQQKKEFKGKKSLTHRLPKNVNKEIKLINLFIHLMNKLKSLTCVPKTGLTIKLEIIINKYHLKFIITTFNHNFKKYSSINYNQKKFSLSYKIYRK